MSETRLKLNLFHIRKGEKPEAVETYYVLGRKPAGGMVARVVIAEDLDLRRNDTLVFDFTTEKVCDTERSS
jgi:hypothetical protein